VQHSFQKVLLNWIDNQPSRSSFSPEKGELSAQLAVLSPEKLCR